MRRPAVRRAAKKYWNQTCHAAHAGAAGNRPCILSRKACSCRCFAHFLHSKRHILREFTTKRPRNADIRFLLRESMPISCHEETEKFFKVRPIWPKQAIRYPIDTLSIPDFPKLRSHFASHLDALGPDLNRFSRILDRIRDSTDKETGAATGFDPDFGTHRRDDPQRGRQLAPKAGCLLPCHRPIRGRNPRSAADETGGHLPVV